MSEVRRIGYKPKAEPDFVVVFIPIRDGKTALVCSGEADAWPWVNLLTRAGFTLEHSERAGAYAFDLAELPELFTTPTPAELHPYHWLDDQT